MKLNKLIAASGISLPVLASCPLIAYADVTAAPRFPYVSLTGIVILMGIIIIAVAGIAFIGYKAHKHFSSKNASPIIETTIVSAEETPISVEDEPKCKEDTHENND